MSSTSLELGSVTTQLTSPVPVSVNHPRLDNVDLETIRVLLSLYDQYCTEMKKRAKQLPSSSTTTDEVGPVDLKFCVDPEYLEYAITLDYIEGVESYQELSDSVLLYYLEDQAAESNDSVTLEGLDAIVHMQR